MATEPEFFDWVMGAVRLSTRLVRGLRASSSRPFTRWYPSHMAIAQTRIGTAGQTISPRLTRLFTRVSSVFIRSTHELLSSLRAFASHSPSSKGDMSLGGEVWMSDCVNGVSARVNSPSDRPVTISKFVACRLES